MTEDKFDMQADGSGTAPREADDKGELASRRDQHSGSPQTGESGGGAYPNPHTGKGGSPDGPDKFGGHGGQTDIAYHGGNRRGDEGEGAAPNAAAEED